MTRAWLLLTLAALPLLAPPALAQEAGSPIVREVRFEGEVEEADRLYELLRLKPGQPYAPEAARETLSLYYQKGLFQSIAVEQQPVAGGVDVVFRFQRQRIIAGWRFEGNPHLDAGTLARTFDLTWGQPLNPRNFPRYAERIHDRYLREGYFQAKAEFAWEPRGDREAFLTIRVSEGPALRLSALRILDPGPLTEAVVRDALQLKAGDRLPREALFNGLERLEERLSEAGYLNNRVSHYFLLPDGSRQSNYYALTEQQATSAELVLAIDQGVRGVVQVDGDVLLPTKELAEAITVYDNRSYSPYELDVSAEKLRALYVSRGYPQAKVTHRLEETKDETYLITFVVAAGPRVEVAAIDFVGNDGFPAETLREVIALRPPGFLREGYFNPQIWEEDLARLRIFYRNRGYLSAQVTEGERRIDPETQAVTLVARIEEGPQTRVARLLFEGVSPFHEAGILQGLTISPGAPYNPGRLGEYLSSIEAYYAKSGYPLARVTGELVPGETPAASALRFTVVPGARKRFGDVLFRGNVKTDDAVVRRQLTIRRGRWYNSEEVLKTQQQLYQLGFFDRVNVGPLRPISADPDEPVDLVAELQERETGWVSIGGGYSQLREVQGPAASVEYVQNNLFGQGMPLRTEGTLSQLTNRATVTLRDPYFLDQALIGESGFTFLHDRARQGLELVSWGPTLGLSKQLSDRLLGSVRYSWNQVDYLQATPEQMARIGGLQRYTNSVASIGVTYDSRSDLLNPRWGTRTDLTVDLASPLFGGNLIYTRPRVTVAHHVPITRRIIFAVGAELGYTQSLAGQGELPYDLLFLAGGANSLRGYNPLTVGIPDGPPGTPGRGLLLGHLETRFPIWGDLGGVVFLDAGNVWADPGDLNPFDLRVTFGPGLRYQTPVGPVRIDYGFRLRPQLEFGAFHFGLGQAF